VRTLPHHARSAERVRRAVQRSAFAFERAAITVVLVAVVGIGLVGVLFLVPRRSVQ